MPSIQTPSAITPQMIASKNGFLEGRWEPVRQKLAAEWSADALALKWPIILPKITIPTTKTGQSAWTNMNPECASRGCFASHQNTPATKAMCGGIVERNTLPQPELFEEKTRELY